MLDNDVYKVLVSTVKLGLTERGVPNTLVRQSYQPTQQAVKTGQCIFLHKLPSPQGSYGLEYTDTGERIQISYATSVFQVSALSPQNPADINSLTAYDLLTKVSDHLQSYDTIRQLQQGGIPLMRITNISADSFQNNFDQFELSPFFTLTLQNNRSYTKSIPQVDRVTGLAIGV